jgi:hypothetical protein
MVAGRQRIDPFQMIAFDPILEFSGLIAGILADLEHRNNNNLDGNSSWRCEQGWDGQAYEKQEAGDPSEGHISMICTDPGAIGRQVALAFNAQSIYD